MRQVCGLEKTLINAANVVAQTSLCCTFFPVFSPCDTMTFHIRKTFAPQIFFYDSKKHYIPTYYMAARSSISIEFILV